MINRNKAMEEYARLPFEPYAFIIKDIPLVTASRNITRGSLLLFLLSMEKHPENEEVAVPDVVKTSVVSPRKRTHQ